MVATLVVGAFSEPLFDITGLVASEVKLGTLFIIASLIIGYVGGRGCDWRVTISGIFMFGVCAYLGGLYDEMGIFSLSNEMDWRFTVILAGFPMLIPAAISHRLSRRWWAPPPPGHCQSCGYNLTGLTENRCPECGQAFTPRRDKA